MKAWMQYRAKVIASLAGVLVVVALIPSTRPSKRRAVFAKPVPTAQHSVPNRESESTNMANSRNDSEMKERAMAWVASDGSDPFGAEFEAQPAHQEDPWAAAAGVSLTAVWQQGAKRLAVLNGSVVAEGGAVAGFTLSHCDRTAVWLGNAAGARRIALSRLAQTTRPRREAGVSDTASATARISP